MHFITALSRAGRALIVLAVAGTGLAATLLTGAAPASAGPLSVSSVTATDLFGQAASQVWTTEAVNLTVTASANAGTQPIMLACSW
jgi:hypothetical protein